MTAAEFKSRYGADWRKQSAKPWFAAFISILEDESPSRVAPDKTDMNERLNGSIALYNEIIGHEKLARIIRGLIEEEKPTFEPPTTFTEPEDI